MARSRRLKLYEFVKDVVELGAGVLKTELDLDPARAREVMVLAAKQICFKNAKSMVYIPEAVNLVNMERNALIWAAYQVDGSPPACARKFSPERALELAVEHDLSPQQIYNILRDHRMQEIDARQAQIPDLEPPS